MNGSEGFMIVRIRDHGHACLRRILACAGLLLFAGGCTARPEAIALGGMSSFRGTEILTLQGPKGKIRLWFDSLGAGGGVRVTGPEQPPPAIPSQPDDRRPGFAGSRTWSDGRVLIFRCLTADARQGTMEFTLDGNPIPGVPDSYSLDRGRLFLIQAKGGAVALHQLDREIRDADDATELEALGKEDAVVRKFLEVGAAGPAPAK
jgi:hypothetical protein